MVLLVWETKVSVPTHGFHQDLGPFLFEWSIHGINVVSTPGEAFYLAFYEGRFIRDASTTEYRKTHDDPYRVRLPIDHSFRQNGLALPYFREDCGDEQVSYLGI